MSLIIIFQTYARTNYAVATIRAIKQNLKYEPGYHWIVADDGSDDAHADAVQREIGIQNILEYRNERIGYGALANWAWEFSNHYGAVTLWLEDDWTLDREFDPTHYVERLNNNAQLGIIRLARWANGLRGEVVGDGAQCYLKLEHTPYYFSGNPSLRHIRFFHHYGGYPTGLNPGDTELGYDRNIQAAEQGPHVFLPVDIGTWGLFGHIGTEVSYNV